MLIGVVVGNLLLFVTCWPVPWFVIVSCFFWFLVVCCLLLGCWLCFVCRFLVRVVDCCLLLVVVCCCRALRDVIGLLFSVCLCFVECCCLLLLCVVGGVFYSLSFGVSCCLFVCGSLFVVCCVACLFSFSRLF